MNQFGNLTLYAATNDCYSHQIRIVLAEKETPVHVIHIDKHNPSEDLLALNPYNTLPTLVDRDLVLYDQAIILDYLEERFPHPPLFPIYPAAKAETRTLMHRIKTEWYNLVEIIQNVDETIAEKTRAQLCERLIDISPWFEKMPYFMSEEFSLLDCYILPLLWRLPYLGIHLNEASALEQYQQKMFARPSFQVSLNNVERHLR